MLLKTRSGTKVIHHRTDFVGIVISQGILRKTAEKDMPTSEIITGMGARVNQIKENQEN